MDRSDLADQAMNLVMYMEMKKCLGAVSSKTRKCTAVVKPWEALSEVMSRPEMTVPDLLWASNKYFFDTLSDAGGFLVFLKKLCESNWCDPMSASSYYNNAVDEAEPGFQEAKRASRKMLQKLASHSMAELSKKWETDIASDNHEICKLAQFHQGANQQMKRLQYEDCDPDLVSPLRNMLNAHSTVAFTFKFALPTRIITIIHQQRGSKDASLVTYYTDASVRTFEDMPVGSAGYISYLQRDTYLQTADHEPQAKPEVAEVSFRPGTDVDDRPFVGEVRAIIMAVENWKQKILPSGTGNRTLVVTDQLWLLWMLVMKFESGAESAMMAELWKRGAKTADSEDGARLVWTPQKKVHFCFATKLDRWETLGRRLRLPEFLEL
mmetsp:Transcript_100692/g.285360  ORF Transcript_100692/g.285360 Transcript_100692/m.285360 type:complete len:380 (+) Transcript_100692:107-1246(+)|eukprot:CAMPEP_0179268206 /NCGR_PEP_ID=MMETSP0797-20121207/30322_1 /TAXON_ID=47934 /ORGANISM="Dinophysis acuminata, Strain DAEP01" /LENGTH=379 /DNA_ID=CAMNT_0020976483 /DNA_START=74 /DNA_END=1213 /DNA_ORIENTATION=-